MSEAYQILSDEKLRKRYDQFGIEEGVSPDGGFMNPQDIFQRMFGGEMFAPIIGEFMIAKLMSDAAEQQEAETTQEKQPEPDLFTKEKRAESKEIHEKRIKTLRDNLIKRTQPLTAKEKTVDAFRTDAVKEAHELAKESYGPQLLYAVGYVYESKARHYLTKDGWFGIRGFWSSLREKGHTISAVVDTVSAYRELSVEDNPKRHSKKVAATALSDEDKAELTEKKMMNFLWKASSLEVQMVLQEVCSSFLAYESVPGYKAPLTPESKKPLKPVLVARAEALLVLGEAYLSVSAQENKPKAALK